MMKRNEALATRMVEQQPLTGECKNMSAALKATPGFMLGYSGSKYVLDAYARYLSELTGGEVDWGYVGGRPVWHADDQALTSVLAHADAFPLGDFHDFFLRVRGSVDDRNKSGDNGAGEG